MLLAGMLPVMLHGMDSHAADNVANQQVTFTSADGSVLAGTLTMPNNLAGKIPGVTKSSW